MFVNTYVAEPELLVIVTPVSERPVRVTSTLPDVGETISYSTLAIGATLSIQFTVAVTNPVFPDKSSNSNVNVPFPVKIYHVNPPLLVTTIGSERPVSTATTSVFVREDGAYSTVAVGAIKSEIHDTVAVAEPVLPAISSNSNTNEPFQVKT